MSMPKKMMNLQDLDDLMYDYEEITYNEPFASQLYAKAGLNENSWDCYHPTKYECVNYFKGWIDNSGNKTTIDFPDYDDNQLVPLEDMLIVPVYKTNTVFSVKPAVDTNFSDFICPKFIEYSIQLYTIHSQDSYNYSNILFQSATKGFSRQTVTITGVSPNLNYAYSESSEQTLTKDNYNYYGKTIDLSSEAKIILANTEISTPYTDIHYGLLSNKNIESLLNASNRIFVSFNSMKFISGYCNHNQSFASAPNNWHNDFTYNYTSYNISEDIINECVEISVNYVDTTVKIDSINNVKTITHNYEFKLSAKEKTYSPLELDKICFPSFYE